MRKIIISFISQLLATFLGITLFSFLVLVGSALLVYDFIDEKVPPPTPEEPCILHVLLDGTSVYHKEDSWFSSNDGTVDLSKLRKTLFAAASDPSIAGVHLELRDFQAGLSDQYLIGTMLEKFKQGGKQVVVSAYCYGESQLAMASCADQIFLHPEGMVAIQGGSIQRTFYKGLSDKLGVDVHVSRTGAHKTATDSWTREQISDEDREQLSTFCKGVYEHHLATISENRSIPKERLQGFADTMPFMTAEEAHKEGLIDALGCCKEDIKAYFRETSQEEDSTHSQRHISYTVYHRYLEMQEEGKGSIPKIGVVVLQGDIVRGDHQFNRIASEDVKRRIDDCVQDPAIRGIILVVDSPGGDSFATADIRYAVQRADRIKPVYCVMANTTASGGYAIAMGTRKSIITPYTLTGSIGVCATHFNVRLLLERFGINVMYIDAAKHSSMGSPFRELSGEEQEMKRKHVEHTYQRFIGCVSQHTGIPRKHIEQHLAGGRIFSAWDASKQGMVHYMGTLDDAITMMAQELNSVGQCMVVYPSSRRISCTARLRQYLHDLMRSSYLRTLLIAMMQEEQKETAGVQMRLPYVVH